MYISPCVGIHCGDPGLGPYLLRSVTSFKYPGTVAFSCPVGFNLHGVSVARCSANGTWNAALPHCTPLKCPVPTISKHAHIVSVNATFNGSLQLACNLGYVLNEQQRGSFRCNSSAAWLPDVSKFNCDGIYWDGFTIMIFLVCLNLVQSFRAWVWYCF